MWLLLVFPIPTSIMHVYAIIMFMHAHIKVHKPEAVEGARQTMPGVRLSSS
jgi:hypothetical protein